MNNEYVIGADIGGSHITAALVNLHSGAVVDDSKVKVPVNAGADADDILSRWTSALDEVCTAANGQVAAIGIAMPGPFDYEGGISQIKGVAKYESLYGMNIRTALQTSVPFAGDIYFENDASCFALGEAWSGEGAGCSKMVAVTLGTGLGGTFLHNNRIQHEGEGVPPEGYIYHLPYKDGIAEDYISSRWLLNEYHQRTGNRLAEVKCLGELAEKGDDTALQLFAELGHTLGEVLHPWLAKFQAERMVIGGNIRKAHPYFLPALDKCLSAHGISTSVHISNRGENSALSGAAWICKSILDNINAR
ncbi:ROK family protein [Chitinophaga horti]|uniref:ROK family protein n=1 Tax=Chitinophaga horti TaxID=2920382 RepID=A0ABY6J3B7_9BACT|nr:ROK family protein [Chitinophaga horti]UYQ94155.1 ROK family protein [Chitinophaga horti]